MKAKITRPDGTVIELDGTVDEVEKIIGAAPQQSVTVMPVPVPYTPYVPAAPQPQPWTTPQYPFWYLSGETYTFGDPPSQFVTGLQVVGDTHSICGIKATS